MKKAKKKIPKHIYDEVYMTNYYVFYGWKAKDFKDWYKRKYNEDLEYELLSGFCRVEPRNNCRIIFIWTNKKDISTLVHECLHATFFTLENRFVLSYENDEAYCYLLESLVRRISKGDKY